VCVKRSGDRSSKLDRNDFTGIFLGFTATDHNILYLDMESELVKRSHHAQFDEAWYLQSNRPPAAQLLYDLGLEVDSDDDTEDVPQLPPVPWPPLATYDSASGKFLVPPSCLFTPLPLRETLALQRPTTAAAARTHVPHSSSPVRAKVPPTTLPSTSPSDIVKNISLGSMTWP
jgi:hypothetical protein